MRTITAIIADDEPPARQYLRMLLPEFPEVQVVRECTDGRETLSAIHQLRPELLFLDVQMPELDGFAVLENVEPMAMPAVIFVTAYDAFALRAFEVHALDYLLKPFTRARFRAAMAHTLEQLLEPKHAREDSRLPALLRELRLNRREGRVAITTNEGVYFVPAAEIDWIEAAGNYAKLHTATQTHQLRETLKTLEAKLDPTTFVRVHRSAIVNLSSIHRLEPWFHGEYAVRLRDGTRLMCSRKYSPSLRALTKNKIV
jgi:two-component system, LytTR family, response regulator